VFNASSLAYNLQRERSGIKHDAFKRKIQLSQYSLLMQMTVQMATKRLITVIHKNEKIQAAVTRNKQSQQKNEKTLKRTRTSNKIAIIHICQK
jgi:hypothetical protein